MEYTTEKSDGSEDETSKRAAKYWEIITSLAESTPLNGIFHFAGKNAKSFMELVLRYKDSEIFSNKELSDEIITLITAVCIQVTIKKKKCFVLFRKCLPT